MPPRKDAKASRRSDDAAAAPPSDASPARTDDTPAEEPQRSLTELIRPGVGAAVLLVIALFAQQYIREAQAVANASFAPPAVAHSVPRIIWKQDPSFFEAPVILVGTPATHWSALRRWTPAYIEKHVPVLRDAYRHAGKVFTFYDPNKPLAAIEGIGHDLAAAHRIEDVDTKEFFAKASAVDSQGEYLYYSGPVEDFGEELLQDIVPYEWMRAQEGEYFTVNAWMGYNGTTAHTHYDIFHNFNVQIYGRKRFLLIPPSNWTAVYHYPRIHPKYRQSQVDYEAPNLNKFPRFSEVDVYEANLEPGDTLYLPPYWNHRVTALSTSISINTFSETKELLTFYDLQTTSISFLPKRDIPERARAAAAFISAIMRDLGWTAREARTFMRHQYEAHYEPLRSILQVKVSAGRVALPSCWTAPSLSDADNTLLAQSAAIVAAKLATIPNDLLEITLGSYLEEIGRVAVGADMVFEFVKMCFP